MSPSADLAGIPLVGLNCSGQNLRKALNERLATPRHGVGAGPFGLRARKLYATNEEGIDNGFIYAVEADKSIEVVV
jgi:hypothetical protein